MEHPGVLDAVKELLASDPDVASANELAEISRWSATLRNFSSYVDVRVNRRSEQLAAAGEAPPAGGVLIDEGRLSGKDAKATGERDRVCTDLPAFEEALAAGDCTGGHLDALATHTKGLTDDERADLHDVVDDLLHHATNDPVGLFDRKAKSIIDRTREIHRPGSDADELDRQRTQSKVKRWTDRDTGMKQTLISLDPLRDAALHTTINAHLEQLRHDPANKNRPFDELKVEAVMASVQSSSSDGRRIPEVVVHVDHESACHGRHPDTLCETVDGVSVPVATVQRLCCEAILQAVIVHPDGTTDQLCAELRTANRAQRRQLAAMYATCAHPHCEIGFSHCRIHHIVWFTRGGTTVLSNLLPLCETHHHLVHEGGWNLTIDHRRRVTWIQPDGTIWHTDDGPNRRATPKRARAPAA